MAYVSDITITPLSGLNHIDALLDKGPDWNYLTGANNTIRYTFSTDSGNETSRSGQSSFSAAQQTNARTAMAMVSAVTGINFVETTAGTAAQVHFANTNISGSSTSGLCSWSINYSYNPPDNSLNSYSAQAYIYLDNVEFGSQNANLAPGGNGYETLLHEIGHMLGLKHPFDDGVNLPSSEDNTVNTLLSYTDVGGPYNTFAPYDIAALNWLYGRDGLGGALGIGSSSGGRYLTGTTRADSLSGGSAADVLRGDGGNDSLFGGGGDDTAVFSAAFSTYTFAELSGGRLGVTGADGTDILDSIEILRFADRSVRRAELVPSNSDTTAPLAPTLAVTKLASGYVSGNTPTLSGSAEANAVVKIYSGNALVATTVANASGAYSTGAPLLVDGTYLLYATATDAAGNVSLSSVINNFKVDVTAPTSPTASVGGGAVVASNQPVITGSGEAGTTISVSTALGVLGETTVGASGIWKVTPLPLANGTYSVNVKSTDGAGYSTTTAGAVTFTVSSSLNASGVDANESFNSTAGNNVFDGRGGIDTVRYASTRASYTVSKSDAGFTITAAGGSDGIDTLVNIERLQFSNGASALDVAGNGGQSYRIYKAAFDRTPDSAGLGFWIKAMDDGQNLRDVAKGFLGSAEFTQLYGANASNTAFVTKLYEHVLHRGPDGAGFDFWVNGLSSNATSRADVLAYFSESGENQAQVIGQIQNGFDYTPWA